MWRRLKNIFVSCSTYADLGPDLRIRRFVNRGLGDRAFLTAEAWYKQFWHPLGISQPVAEFVYTHMPTYCGLEFARVQPLDRLNEDLHLPLVCWFDWELSLWDDFCACFEVNPCDCLDLQQVSTVKELVVFLDGQRTGSENEV